MCRQSEQFYLRLATAIALTLRAKRPVRGVQVGGERQSLAGALVDRSKLCLAVVIAVVGSAGKLWAEAVPASIIAVEFDAPAAGTDFVTGDTTRVRFNFNQNVSVDTTNGVPTAAVALGLAYRHKVSFRYSDKESEDAVLVFTHEVSDADIMDQPRGLWIGANSVSLNGGTISNDGADVAADLTHPHKYTRYSVNHRTTLKSVSVRPKEHDGARNEERRVARAGVRTRPVHQGGCLVREGSSRKHRWRGSLCTSGTGGTWTLPRGVSSRHWYERSSSSSTRSRAATRPI